MADVQRLCCIHCYGSLSSDLRCSRCGTQYERAANGVPILMTPEDCSRFGALLHREASAPMQADYARRRVQGARAWIRKLYPPEPVYVNPLAPPLPAPRPGLNLWIGGGGLELPGFVNVDVAAVPGVDVIANASRLPFGESTCDSIACLALLEHVIDPERVVEEIHRALKPGGEAQIVVPFCHPYHAYPADYSRFSRERLEKLLHRFAVVDIGIRTGPTVTMLTFLTYYLKILLPVHGGPAIRRGFNRLAVGGIGWLIFPLKYLDKWMNRLPGAEVLANHFYAVARK